MACLAVPAVVALCNDLLARMMEPVSGALPASNALAQLRHLHLSAPGMAAQRRVAGAYMRSSM